MEMIKTLRKQKGLTMKQLGELVGVSDGAISQYESGNRQPPVDICVKLADVFDCSLDLLIRGKEKDRPERRSVDEVFSLIKSMTPEERGVALAIAAYLKSNREDQGRQGQGSAETP